MEIIRKKIKNIYIRVSSGHVRVSAPLWMKTSEIEDFIKARSAWISKHLGAPTAPEETDPLMDRRHRQELLALLPKLAEPWEKKMGVKVNLWRVKKMKSRWGSAKVSAGIICMNSELMKKPFECLEYVLVHELAHLLERGHNAGFYALMDSFMPDWRERKAKLKA